MVNKKEFRLKLLLISLLILMGHGMVISQDDLTLLNARPVDPDRYERIKGSPYLFKDWMRATITQSSGNKVNVPELNLNGHSGNFEVRKGDQFIELVSDFVSIEIKGEEAACGDRAFIKYYHPRIKNPYPLFIFHGEKYKLVLDFRVSLVENKIETPGKTEKFKTFSDIYSYYLIRGEDMHSVKLNKKSLLEAISREGAAEFVSSEKINLSSADGACRLLQWADKQD